MTTSAAAAKRADGCPSAQVVRAYHERTKHRPTAYAVGPETLDWENQPAPFRRFAGAPDVPLPRSVDPHLARLLRRSLSSLLRPSSEPAAPSLRAFGTLLHLSLGITAWKSFGPDRWAVRANPSSGNLHPVEAYLILRSLPELPDGVYHYRPEDHALECRARFAVNDGCPSATPMAWVGLSTVMWRETWKYGERAFRYCQLDTGHAIGALSCASALLGWRLFQEPQIGTESLARALGLDRLNEFPANRDPDTEKEEAELLLAVSCDGSRPPPLDPRRLSRDAEHAEWAGVASTIDPHPMARWPIMNEIAVATRFPDETRFSDETWWADDERAGPPAPEVAIDARPSLSGPEQGQHGAASAEASPSDGGTDRAAADVILTRRSAQRFDARHWLAPSDFFGLLSALGPDAVGTLGGRASPPSLALVLFVHRVSGLEPGAYFLARRVRDKATLADRLALHFPLLPVEGAPLGLDLRLIASVEARHLARVARALHCHQDLAAQACFALGMVAEFDQVVGDTPAAYRTLHREAGMLGHVLYLEAEVRGLRGTGIGCFFDDSLHELLKLADTQFQTLYHFAVGKPIDDPRIETTSTGWPAAVSSSEGACTP
ncbi:MAG TPA: SagB family peptide dehydrogenase [Polyangiaceae bacterium]|nr:SagB family peptide dehydrogenase [Polyangiaceae bacterium]